MENNQWKRVIFLSDCIFEEWDEDKEFAVCPVCQIEYSECPCPGPTQDDQYEYKEIDGQLYARLK